ncbi:hypothetical protein [Actinomadura bangladeshensis]|uniref:Uncharacterized protein n=1 Tax=Actinomadura bangladeshensis TaxID=453573 RepID=A0A6L9Q917_9ACTN|nr:hypothetical protein [Actinomadura bangladeshensis]NEA21552.1 hypothetical protein [Actinomadura bangladeshensis]NEA22512.1 hypothetical protein [Actinomadura bangladeshensis]
MTTTAEARTRDRLAKHLRYCPLKAGSGCLQCAAARLVESLPAAEPAADVRPVLEDMLATVERAAGELDEVIAHLGSADGAAMRDALNSLAVTSPSGALTAILARAACTPDQPEAALTRATERLDRVRVLHARLVDEHHNDRSWLTRLGVTNARADIIRRLAQAWHGGFTSNPFQPLNH